MEEPTRFPVPAKYYSMKRRYRFNNRLDAEPLNFRHPVLGSEATTVRRNLLRRRQQKTEEIPNLRIGDLPGLVLLNIFGYSNPLDVVHSFSKVCKRWNYLAKLPALYKEVRVILDDQSLYTGSAKCFLNRGRKQIKKLFLYCEAFTRSDVVADVFPDCMPRVSELHISVFTGSPPELLRILPACFPNLVTLIMDNTTLDFFDYEGMERMETRSELFRGFFSQWSFPRLKIAKFSITNGTPEEFFDRFCSWERPIESVRICDFFSIDFRKLGGCFFKETITELHLEGGITSEGFHAIGSLKNLKRLSLLGCSGTSDEALNNLKALNKVESFMLKCFGWDSGISRNGITRFLSLPASNRSEFFPCNVKHLALIGLQSFGYEAASTLVQSCPALESLNICRNRFIGRKALSLIVASLRNLRFLNVSRLGDTRCSAIRHLRQDQLPHLKLLVAHRTKGLDEKILEALNLQRRHLLISSREDFFINWTVRDGKPEFKATFDGDFDAIIDDLLEDPGFRCMDFY